MGSSTSTPAKSAFRQLDRFDQKRILKKLIKEELDREPNSDPVVGVGKSLAPVVGE